jgi:SAM-dependent methyltransferase
MATRMQTAVGEYWSARKPSTGNWWTNRMVVRDINRRVIGEPHAEISRGAVELGRRLAGGRPLRRGISVGCGNGGKEIALVRDGVVGHMLGYDLAEARLAHARETAAGLGLSDRIEFRQGDAFVSHAGPEFDFVYWNNSLHHMFDVPAALTWSRDVLRPGGLLLIDEFVGPSRMRFDDETLAFANAVRGLLPERLLAPARPGRPADRRLDREWFAARIARDPSEAADSGRTLAAVTDLFTAPVVRLTGGVVYFIALNGLFGNLDMALPEDRQLLGHLLTLDEIYTAAYPARTVYAVAAALR